MSLPKAERERLHLLTRFEREARQQGHKVIVGIDEAGRGPLAGPVVAAACFIPEGIYFHGVDDSKKLKSEARQKLYQEITAHPGVLYGVGIVSHEVIDLINILQATIRAMIQAVDALSLNVDMMLVDGMNLPHPKFPSLKIIEGDALSQSIAAASIIAKETRDRIMEEYHEIYPHYGFGRHKGYGTEFHRKALEVHGPSPIHRRSFKCKESKGQ